MSIMIIAAFREFFIIFCVEYSYLGKDVRNKSFVSHLSNPVVKLLLRNFFTQLGHPVFDYCSRRLAKFFGELAASTDENFCTTIPRIKYVFFILDQTILDILA